MVLLIQSCVFRRARKSELDGTIARKFWSNSKMKSDRSTILDQLIKIHFWQYRANWANVRHKLIRFKLTEPIFLKTNHILKLVRKFSISDSVTCSRLVLYYHILYTNSVIYCRWNFQNIGITRPTSTNRLTFKMDSIIWLTRICIIIITNRIINQINRFPQIWWGNRLVIRFQWFNRMVSCIGFGEKIHVF